MKWNETALILGNCTWIEPGCQSPKATKNRWGEWLIREPVKWTGFGGFFLYSRQVPRTSNCVNRAIKTK